MHASQSGLFPEVLPLSPYLGARWDVQLAEHCDDPDFVWKFKQHLNKHLIILIRGQEIEPAKFERFARNFGPLMDIKRPNTTAVHVPEASWIKVISNVTTEDGRMAGDGNCSAQTWHTDNAFWKVPCDTLLFHCRMSPKIPPKTYFKNMKRVYESLPDATKEKIANLQVMHYQYPNQSEMAVFLSGATYPVEERLKGNRHPLVRRHLSTNEPFLFLPARRDCIIDGMTPEQSVALLAELWAAVDASPAHIGIGLEPGDTVVWDNSALLHTRDGWDPAEGRIMWHISCHGEVPTPMFSPHVANRAVARDAVPVNDY